MVPANVPVAVDVVDVGFSWAPFIVAVSAIGACGMGEVLVAFVFS